MWLNLLLWSPLQEAAVEVLKARATALQALPHGSLASLAVWKLVANEALALSRWRAEILAECK